MSLNPVLVKSADDDLLMPQLRDGETYILTRPHVHIKVVTPDEILRGKGHIVITDQRIVFVKFRNLNFGKRYSSISLPFLLMSRPLYQQPAFTPNYFQFNILPDTIETFHFSGEGRFYIYFFKGNSNLFLHHFYIYYARNKNNPTRPIPTSDNNSSTYCEGCVLVDPSDLTKIYLTQPDTSPAPEDAAFMTSTTNTATTATSTTAPNAVNRTRNLLHDYDRYGPLGTIIVDTMRNNRILSRFLPARFLQ